MNRRSSQRPVGAQKIVNASNTPSQAVSNAPTVIYFDVEDSFQYYAGGVYQPTDCGTTINHGRSLCTVTQYVSALDDKA